MESSTTTGNNRNRGPKKAQMYLMAVLFSLILSFFFSSCGPQRCVLHDREIRTQWRQDTSVRAAYDSLIVRDTVVISQQGDTIFVNRIHWRYRSRLSTLFTGRTVLGHDSILRMDTVYRSAYQGHSNHNNQGLLTLWKNKKVIKVFILLSAVAIAYGIYARVRKHL